MNPYAFILLPRKQPLLLAFSWLPLLYLCLNPDLTLAQSSCNFQCSTNNVTIDRSFIADRNTCQPIINCVIEDQVDAVIGFDLLWNTSADRYCVKV